MCPSEPRPVPPARSLAVWPCQSVCVWRSTEEIWLDDRHPDLRVFACTACGSEWVRSQSWTPIDAAGVVPVDVARERALTSGRDVDAADIADR